MHILHKEESRGRVDYILTSENRHLVLSLNTNENTPDDTPNAHTIRFWHLANSNTMTKIGYKKSEEKEALNAFREILSATKDSLANLSDFKLTEPRSKSPKSSTKEVPKDAPTAG